MISILIKSDRRAFKGHWSFLFEVIPFNSHIAKSLNTSKSHHRLTQISNKKNHSKSNKKTAKKHTKNNLKNLIHKAKVKIRNSFCQINYFSLNCKRSFSQKRNLKNSHETAKRFSHQKWARRWRSLAKKIK